MPQNTILRTRRGTGAPVVDMAAKGGKQKTRRVSRQDANNSGNLLSETRVQREEKAGEETKTSDTRTE